MARFTRDILPGAPLIEAIELPPGLSPTELVVQVLDCHGEQILGYRPSVPGQPKGPPPAQEPPPPEEIASSDELYLVGLHLEQYRHATRWPTPYWREALRRDPLDARSNNALGLWHLRRGEFRLAEPFFRRAIQRLTGHNANPYDGEPFYNLGLCLRHQIDAGDAADDLFADAYAAFSKATWNQAWSGAGYHALAEMDCRRGHWATALEHLDLRWAAIAITSASATCAASCSASWAARPRPNGPWPTPLRWTRWTGGHVSLPASP